MGKDKQTFKKIERQNAEIERFYKAQEQANMEKEEFDFLLSDRIQKIQQIAREYDLENKGYIAFSGGKDSTVLSFLVDLALPNNKIPRIYSNTGIDFNAIRDFVRKMATNDERFFILNPTQNLKKMLNLLQY